MARVTAAGRARQAGNILLGAPVLALSACTCGAYWASDWRRMAGLGLPWSACGAAPERALQRRSAAPPAGAVYRAGVHAAGSAAATASGVSSGSAGSSMSTASMVRTGEARAAKPGGIVALSGGGSGGVGGAHERRGGYFGDAVAPYVMHLAAAAAAAALVLHVQVAACCVLQAIHLATTYAGSLAPHLIGIPAPLVMRLNLLDRHGRWGPANGGFCLMHHTTMGLLHAQVATRFLSACPPLYWYAAHLTRSGGRPGLRRAVWAFFLCYGALGTLFFPNFYPWT